LQWENSNSNPANVCSHDDRRNSNSNAASVCPPIIPPHDDRTTIKVPASAGQSKTIKDPQRTQTQTPFQPISHRHGPNPVTLTVKYNRALTAAHGKCDFKLKANGIRLGYAAPGVGKVCVPLTLSAKLGRAILKAMSHISRPPGWIKGLCGLEGGSSGCGGIGEDKRSSN